MRKKTKSFILSWLFLSIICLASCKKEDKIPALIPENDQNTYSMMHNGIKRTMIMHVPPSYDGTKQVPLLIGLHGSGSSGQDFQSLGFNQRADKYGFIVVYPDGHQHSWNIGNESDTRSLGIDDVGFISTLIKTISSHYKIDLSRVYITGHSLGGYMSYRLACEIPDKIAAIAPVAGLNFTFTQERAAKPVAIMHLHAVDDPVVPYNGDPPYVLSVDNLLSAWREINECSPESEEIFNRDGIVGKLWPATETNADIVLYTYERGGHAWLPYATDLICEFFYNHPHKSNSVRIASPCLGDIFDSTATIEIKAEVDNIETINKVEFYANDDKIGEDTHAPFSLNWTNAGIGGYSLKLIAYLKNGETIISTDVVSVWVCLPNIALNKPCFSSSNENNTLTPEYATDGDFFTRWSSQWSDPQWISIDLGSIHKVNGVTLVWEAYGIAYQIQTSTDNNEWTDVYSTTQGKGGTEYIPFQSINIRYVRMYGTERVTHWGYSLWEFQVHGE